MQIFINLYAYMLHCRVSEGLFANDSENGNGSDFISWQNDINSRMRTILLDWLVEVHRKFKLVPASFYFEGAHPVVQKPPTAELHDRPRPTAEARPAPAGKTTIVRSLK